MIVRPPLHEPPSHELAGEDPPRVWRVIKRYSNRKLYDTQSSRYVTLLQIADMVRSGEEIRIIDNQTHEDKTEVTFALIISEQLKARAAEGSALHLLKALICDATPAGSPRLVKTPYQAPRPPFAARPATAGGPVAEAPTAGGPVAEAPAAGGPPLAEPPASAPTGLSSTPADHRTEQTVERWGDSGLMADGTVVVAAEWTAPFEQWKATFERRIAQLPAGEASILRSHVQDLNDRLVELQKRVALPRE